MAILGGQDFWRRGSRMYFRRDPVGGTAQAVRDLGIVREANPTFEATEVEMRDTDCGRNVVVERETVRLDESYDVTLTDFNPDNKALLWLSEPPATWSQAATTYEVEHAAIPGERLLLVDTQGTRRHSLANVAGAWYDGDLSVEPDEITAVNAATRTLTVATNPTGTVDQGDRIIIEAASPNAGTYTVESITTSTIVVVEPLATNETAVTWDYLHGNGTGDGTILAPGVDYEVDSLKRGIIRFLPGSLEIAAPEDVTVMFRTAVVDAGKRLIRPQTATRIEGYAELWLAGENCERQAVRRMRVSISPSAASFDPEDYSTMTLTVLVLSDLTSEDVAGDLLSAVGPVPATS